LRDLKTNFKLLLTNTPLQNNSHELWTFLDLLLPELFDLNSLLEINAIVKISEENVGDTEKHNVDIMNQLQKILKHFILR